MADEKKGGGSSPPDAWQVIGLVLLVVALAIYGWYKHSEDPNWNPYNLQSQNPSNSPRSIFP